MSCFLLDACHEVLPVIMNKTVTVVIRIGK
jgi:hypothetical protein